MEQEIKFKCISNDFDEIPEDIAKEAQVSFPEVHKNAKQMANLSKALKEHKADLVMLPFCLTVESEALGAKVTLGDEKLGPRVSEYNFTSIEELENLQKIDYTKGRVKEVLEACEILLEEGETVALSVQGPYTIAQYLIDPKILFRTARKEKEKVEQLLNSIEDAVVEYIEEALSRGINIISYGDSSGTVDILGPKMYKDFSGKYNVNVLKRVVNLLKENQIIHLCGVTSTSLNNVGMISSIKYQYDEELTYGEALKKTIEANKEYKIFGHNCIKKFNIKVKKPVVWAIEL